MNVATPKIFTSREHSRSPATFEVRGFPLKRVQMRTLTLTLSLEKGEANRAMPLQLLASTDLVRTCINGCTT